MEVKVARISSPWSLEALPGKLSQPRAPLGGDQVNGATGRAIYRGRAVRHTASREGASVGTEVDSFDRGVRDGKISMTGPLMPTRPPASVGPPGGSSALRGPVRPKAPEAQRPKATDTQQLGAVRPEAPEAQGSTGTVVGHRRAPKPVFVDRSGRRRRFFVVAGAAAAVFVVLALVSLVGGLFGGSPLPLPGLPNLVNPAPPQPPDQAVTATTRGVTGGSSAGAGGPSGSARPTSATPSSPRHTPSDHPHPTKT
jgi:hypothetical protein